MRIVGLNELDREENKKKKQLNAEFQKLKKQRRKKNKKYPAQKFYHECSGVECKRQILTKFKFCRDCVGFTEKEKERKKKPIDALNNRLPGSFENGKRR